MATGVQPTIPGFVTERLETLERQVRSLTERIWRRQLTPVQQKQSKKKQWLDIIDFWAHIHHVHRHEALIHLARTNCFLLPDEGQELLRNLGLSTPKRRTAGSKPHFGDDGKLRLNGYVIRKVRLRGDVSTVERLLRAFQSANWMTEIDNPFPDKDAQYLNNAVRWTNTNLQNIRFEVRRRGTRVAWVIV